MLIKKAWSYWPHAAWVLSAVVVAYAISRTSIFQSCYADHQQYASYKQQQESFYVLSWVFRNFKVWLKCGGDWAEHSHGLLTALATFAIAGFTFTLWRSTRNLWAVTKLSAEHIPTVERAWIFGVPEFYDPPNVAPSAIRRHRLRIRNDGKTPGFVREIFSETIPNEPIAISPAYGGNPEAFPMIIPPGKSEVWPNYNLSLNVEYFVGFIRYADVFGAIYVSRFCYRVLQNGQRFEPAGPPAWNAHEKESGG